MAEILDGIVIGGTEYEIGVSVANLPISKEERVTDDAISFCSDDEAEEYAKVTPLGIFAKEVYHKNADGQYVPVSSDSGTKTFSLLTIPYIFDVVNPALYSREYIPRVFAESYMLEKPSDPVLLNHRRDCPICRQRKTTTAYETKTQSITFSANGYTDKTINQTYHCVNESVYNNKNIRLLLFGVSFDAIDYKDDDGKIPEGGSMTMALVEKYIRMGAEDTNGTRNFVSVGTLGHSGGYTFTYNGKTLSCRGSHEARGGNNGVNYLRQPMNFSPDNISYDPAVNGTSATGAVMWYMCGLRYRVPYNQIYSTSGTDYGVYERTTVKTRNLRHTPFGKYHHDYSEILWEFCYKRGWITKVGGTYSTWTESDSQKSTIDDCMTYVANNPDYPWYDINTARESSFNNGVAKDVDDNTQYSLNLSTYLSRYRTMDDLGVRLSSESANPSGESVIGSDGKPYKIGTKITSQSDLAEHDVCTPTHIIWDMLFNDWVFYSGDNTAQDAFDMAELFISSVKSQIGTNVIFGLKAKRENGCMFPNQWSDIALTQSWSPATKQTIYNKLIIEKYADLSKKVSWIPCYAVSLPIATNFSQKFEDFLYGSCIVQSGETYSATSDVTHEGLRCAKAMAYQIYGWLGYTIKF